MKRERVSARVLEMVRQSSSLSEVVKYVVDEERLVGIDAVSLLRDALGWPVAAGGAISAWCQHRDDAKLERDLKTILRPRS
ncbi:MAG: hypothetical protein Q8O67_25815 [Deltaproteobacteria bacterium]|nr:hypothetical protein [Deltaproteobacteria bacterium]